jgi:hypothetical protein
MAAQTTGGADIHSRSDARFMLPCSPGITAACGAACALPDGRMEHARVHCRRPTQTVRMQVHPIMPNMHRVIMRSALRQLICRYA